MDCGPYRPDDYAVAEPLLVVEVLSRSTRTFDQTRTLEEYRTIPTVRHILLLDPEAMQAQILTRESDGVGGWQWQLLAEAEAVIDLPALQIAVPLAECYGDALG